MEKQEGSQSIPDRARVKRHDLIQSRSIIETEFLAHGRRRDCQERQAYNDKWPGKR
jgi:hypothetical protein